MGRSVNRWGRTGLVAALSFAVFACGDNLERPAADANNNTPDARVIVADANTTDAPPTPDASLIDASTIDAAFPDARVPDATPSDAPITMTGCPVGFAGPTCQVNAGGGEWLRVYDISFAANNNWDVAGDPSYDEDNTTLLGGTSYTRVGFYYQLDNDWVWTEVDDFSAQNLARLGVPVDWTFDIAVGNLTVLTNTTSVTPVTNASNGTMEFWPFCYQPGLNGVYDYDDAIGVGNDCFGSMQIHAGTDTIWVFNGWSAPDIDDVGIGNSPGLQPDWTFDANAGSFTTRRLQVYIR